MFHPPPKPMLKGIKDKLYWKYWKWKTNRLIKSSRKLRAECTVLIESNKELMEEIIHMQKKNNADLMEAWIESVLREKVRR